jgi:predicted RNA-binding protein with PIN domain
MIILIDGYNLLKLIAGADRITETERSAFVNLLGRYRLKRGHKVTIVFDAGPCTQPLKEKEHGVEVIYSGEYHTADDIIMNFVKEHPTKEILVVTADREIIIHVEQYNAEVAEPKLFHDKVKSAFKKSPAALKRDRRGTVKTSKDTNIDLDALMQEAAGMKVLEKDESDEYLIPRHHQPKGREVTKKERKRMKKIDKL